MILNDWDLALIKEYPFVFEVSRNNPFHEVVNFAGQTFEDGQYSWKGFRFFFKNKEDYNWFALRWQ